MKRPPGKGVVQRWVIQHRGKHFFREGNIAPDAKLSFEWVLDRGLATEFTRWRDVVAAIDDARIQGFKSRPVFVGEDPQGIQRNLDRCLPGLDTREWLESALTAPTLQSRYLRAALESVTGTASVIFSDELASYLTGEVQRLEKENHRLQTKDVSAVAILTTVAKIQDAGSTWATLSDLMVSSPDLVNLPRKVVAAKCGKLQKQGLLDGHSGAEFRNEYELTERGSEWVQAEGAKDHVHKQTQTEFGEEMRTRREPPVFRSIELGEPNPAWDVREDQVGVTWLCCHGLPVFNLDAAFKRAVEMKKEAEEAEAGVHDYESTACQHGLHDRCRQYCKFCGVLCGCSCHAGIAGMEPEDISSRLREQMEKEGVNTDPRRSIAGPIIDAAAVQMAGIARAADVQRARPFTWRCRNCTRELPQDHDPEKMLHSPSCGGPNIYRRYKCPDGGACHHECEETECFRVQECSPLSTYGEDWKDRDFLAFGTDQQRADMENRRRSEDRESGQIERTADASDDSERPPISMDDGSVHDGVPVYLGHDQIGHASVEVVNAERGEFKVKGIAYLPDLPAGAGEFLEGRSLIGEPASFELLPGQGITKVQYLYPPTGGPGCHDLSGPRLHGDVQFPRFEPWMADPRESAKAALEFWREQVARGEQPADYWEHVEYPWPWQHQPTRARQVLMFLDLLEWAREQWPSVQVGVNWEEEERWPDPRALATEAYISRDVRGFAERFLEVAQRETKE